MNKLFALIGLALFVVATSALEQQVCPTTRPCCTCECTPKGCPPVKRPDHCKLLKCAFVCPHKCIEDLEMELGEAAVKPNTTCPTTLSCCSCVKVPEGCPEPKRPANCAFIGLCPVCKPHHTEEQEQPEPVMAIAIPPNCPATLPCCSCKKVPEGCPVPKRPEGCKRVGHCPVCPPHHSEEQEQPMAMELVCPATLPCCSCMKVPKGCPEPKRPEGCKRVGHCPVCPHHSEEQQEVPTVMEIAIPPNCPTMRPCCSCEKTPKGCPEPKRPASCAFIGLCPVCKPHHEEQEQPMAMEIVCPKTRPCCSCAKVPKGCPEPKRPEGCKHMHCPVCPPHHSEEQVQEQPQLAMNIIARPPPFVCPMSRPCCSCMCPPKGCPMIPKPQHCEKVKCKFVCPIPCH
jgi:hypothetical protein